MNEDDWSLKGKSRWISDDIANYHIKGVGFEEWYDEEAYKASDIDTLREKLIEDLLEYEEYKELGRESIIELVNKRFGID